MQTITKEDLRSDIAYYINKVPSIKQMPFAHRDEICKVLHANNDILYNDILDWHRRKNKQFIDTINNIAKGYNPDLSVEIKTISDTYTFAIDLVYSNAELNTNFIHKYTLFKGTKNIAEFITEPTIKTAVDDMRKVNMRIINEYIKYVNDDNNKYLNIFKDNLC